MPSRFLAAFLLGFVLNILFIALLKKLSLRYKFLLSGDIPLVGGLGVGFSFLVACLPFIHGSAASQVKGVIFASFIMLVLGILDDWYDLSIFCKFFIQLIAASVLVACEVKTHIFGIGDLSNLMITFIWVIGIANALNHLDVMDGLAAGVALIIDFAFFTIFYLNNDWAGVIFTLSLGGALFGFLIFNLIPNKVYMGNSGSHFLGFMLGAIALTISYAPSVDRRIALLSPLLILGFPIFDTGFLVLIRLIKGKVPFNKSKDHLALRFLSLGHSKGKALLVMFTWSLFLSSCGVLLTKVSNAAGIIVVIFVTLISILLAIKMAKVPVDD